MSVRSVKGVPAAVFSSKMSLLENKRYLADWKGNRNKKIDYKWRANIALTSTVADLVTATLPGTEQELLDQKMKQLSAFGDEYSWFYISFEKESAMINIGYYVNLEFLRKLLHGIKNPLFKVEGQAIVRADTKKPASIFEFNSRLDHEKLGGITTLSSMWKFSEEVELLQLPASLLDIDSSNPPVCEFFLSVSVEWSQLQVPLRQCQTETVPKAASTEAAKSVETVTKPQPNRSLGGINPGNKPFFQVNAKEGGLDKVMEISHPAGSEAALPKRPNQRMVEKKVVKSVDDSDRPTQIDSLGQVLFGDEYTKDVTLVLWDQNELEKSFKCHGLVLAARSHVFKEMLFPAGMENDEGSKVNTIEMVKGVGGDAVEMFLRFVYFGNDVNIGETSTGVLLQLLKIGCHYKISQLPEMVSHFLLQRHSGSFYPDALVDLYCFVKNRKGLRALKNHFIDLMKRDVKKVKVCKRYLELCESSPKTARHLVYHLT